jgi:hypothetical protein
MQMPQGNIIKPFKHGGGNTVYRADRDLLGFRDLSPLYKGMDKQHIAIGRGQIKTGDQSAHRLLRGRNVLPQQGAKGNRAGIRDHMHGNTQTLLHQHNGLDPVLRLPCDKDPLRRKQCRAKGKTLRAVMISRNHQHLNGDSRKTAKEIRQQGGRLLRRNRAIIDIPRDQHGIHLLLLCHIHDL